MHVRDIFPNKNWIRRIPFIISIYNTFYYEIIANLKQTLIVIIALGSKFTLNDKPGRLPTKLMTINKNILD